jgi:hypothetical protein
MVIRAHIALAVGHKLWWSTRQTCRLFPSVLCTLLHSLSIVAPPVSSQAHLTCRQAHACMSCYCAEQACVTARAWPHWTTLHKQARGQYRPDKHCFVQMVLIFKAFYVHQWRQHGSAHLCWCACALLSYVGRIWLPKVVVCMVFHTVMVLRPGSDVAGRTL